MKTYSICLFLLENDEEITNPFSYSSVFHLIWAIYFSILSFPDFVLARFILPASATFSSVDFSPVLGADCWVVSSAFAKLNFVHDSIRGKKNLGWFLSGNVLACCENRKVEKKINKFIFLVSWWMSKQKLNGKKLRKLVDNSDRQIDSSYTYKCT